MNKSLRLLLLPLMLFSTFSLSSCSEDCADYVGSYYLETAYEKSVHYYWGSKNELERKTPSGLEDCKELIINADKSVIMKTSAEDKKGRIVVLFGKASFRSLPFSDSYKFKLSDNNGKKVLTHSWSEDKHAVEYTEKSRYIVFIENDKETD